MRTSDQLIRKSQIFAKIPITDSDCSRVLRLAIVQHTIYFTIRDSFWQPFFSKYLWKHDRDTLTLVDIDSRISSFGEDFKQNWKMSTLKVLDQLDAEVNVGEKLGDTIEGVCAILGPLLNDDQVDQFKKDLKVAFIKAIELGKQAERDQSPVLVDLSPSSNHPNGWKEFLPEEYGNTDMSGTSAPMNIPSKPLLVSPKILRHGGVVAGTTTATTSATATATAIARGAEVEVIQPGLALFPRTGIFQDGASECGRIRSAARDAARQITDQSKKHRMSISSDTI